jgi:Cu2+-exporting ATPase
MGKKYDITGMSCAACSARVESAVRSVDGVKSCAVSLLTNSMTVEGGDEERIISAVRGAGYGIALHTEDNTQGGDTYKKEIRTMVVRLILSVAFSLPLMYLSMGHVMWDFPLPGFLSENAFLIALLQMILALAVMGINYKFFVKGTLGVIHLSPNMDTLVSLCSLASFGWSVWVLIRIGGG